MEDRKNKYWFVFFEYKISIFFVKENNIINYYIF